MPLWTFSHIVPILESLHRLNINESRSHTHTKFLLPQYHSTIICSAPSQHSFLIWCHHFSTITIFLFKNKKSLISFCITTSLESALVSFRKSTIQSPSHSPHFTHGSSPTSSSLLPSITPFLSDIRLKIYLFHKFFPPQTAGTLPLDCLHGLRLVFGLITLIGLFYFLIIIISF